MSDSFDRGRIQDLARQLRENLTSKFQERQARTEATITSVTRDAAGRATAATAIIDGVAAQAVAIDHGASIAPGDSWLVRNTAGAALPRWVAERRLRAAAEVQAPDGLPTLPTPTGLTVDSDVYELKAGSGWRAYLRCSWLSIGAQYGTMGYQVQYMTNDVDTLATATVWDRHPTTLLDGAVDDSQTALPRDPDEAGYQDDFPAFGRVQIESEKVDYTAVTTRAGDSGTGTGAANSFTDGAKSWDTDEWVNYLLTDSAGDVFLVTANTGTVLTVAGTPATGAYTIKPCFSGCTRGAGGTAAAAHDDNTGVGALSVGITLAELQPETDYNVRVRAVSAGGALSAWTAWVSAQTLGDEVPPSTPEGMGYLPAAVNQIELYWDRNPEADMSHYDVELSVAAAPFVAVAGYPREVVATSCRVHWMWGTGCYWHVRAVDQQRNASAYCDVQTATPLLPDPPPLLNRDLEDGVASPDHWTLTTSGRVTTTWGTQTSAKTGLTTRTGQVDVTAGVGGADVDALKSDPFEIDRHQAYSVGCTALRAAAADNVYHFVVFQYQDAGGTPAATPRVELGDISFVGVGAFLFQSFNFTVSPFDTDVTHIGLGISVEQGTTYDQEVHFDDFAIIPRQVVSFPTGEGEVDQDLSSYVHTTLAKTITAQHTFSPGAAQAPFALGANALDQLVAGLNADQLQGLEPSDDPGAAEAILASDASGYLSLVQLNTDVLADKSGGNLTISPAGDLVLDPAGNDVLPAAGYDLNLGSLAKQFLTLHAAELWVQTLVAQDTMATFGGRILVGPTTILAADLGDGAGDTTITVEHNNLANGDRVVMQAAGKLEWMAVASAAGGAGPYTYTVTRNLDGSGLNAWFAGDAVFNTGTTGDGFIDLYSVRGIIPGSTAGPAIVGNVRYGTDYDEIRPAWAIGNLNGLYGYATDVMGVGLGQYSEADYITVDPTNGIRFLDAADAVKAQLTGGEWTIGPAAAQHVSITADDVTIYDDEGTVIFNAGASGNWLSALTVSEGMGAMLFTQADGLLLLGPGGALNATSWTSSRGQAAAITGAFHQVQGAWLGTRGLAIERATTNYIPNPSAEVDTTGWATTGGATIARVTSDHVFGAASFLVVVDGDTNGSAAYIDTPAASFANADPISVSLWLKGTFAGQSITIQCDAMTAAGAFISRCISTNVTLTGAWQRVTASGTCVDATTDHLRLGIRENGADVSVMADGVQIEKATTCTSYADSSLGSGYTASGTVHARAATSVLLSNHVALISGLNTLSFRLVMQMPYAADATWPDSVSVVADARGAHNGLRIMLAYNSTTDAFVVYLNGDYRLASGAQTFAAGDRVELVLTLDFGEDDYRLYVDGALADTDATPMTAPALTVWRLGASYLGLNYANATLDEYAVLGSILTAEQVAAMHAKGQPLVDAGATRAPGLRILDGDFEIATASSGARWHANAYAISGYDAGGDQRYRLGNDGSGWLGDPDTFAWDDTGIVAFDASHLIKPNTTPSLLDALYLPNAGGGGEQMFAWEGISGRLQTSYGSAVWLVQGGPYPTSFGCTNQGGPYRDFDGGTNAMLIFDSGVPEDQWQEPTGNTFLLWAWVNADVLATTNRTVLAKWEASGKYQYILYWDVTVGAFRFVISGNGTNTTVVDSSIAESTGVWYFIAGFYNPSTLLRIYVAPATASALTINSNTTSIPASIKDSTSPLEFGQFAGGSFWDGKIGVCAAWRGMPAASVDDYVELLFNKTKQFYGG